MPFPQPVRPAEGGKPAFGGHAGAGQDDDIADARAHPGRFSSGQRACATRLRVFVSNPDRSAPPHKGDCHEQGHFIRGGSNRDFFARCLRSTTAGKVIATSMPPRSPPTSRHRRRSGRRIMRRATSMRSPAITPAMRRLRSPGAPLATDAATRAKELHALVDDPHLALTFESDRVEVAQSGDLAYSRGHYSLQMTDPATKKPATSTGTTLPFEKRRTAGGKRSRISSCLDQLPLQPHRPKPHSRVSPVQRRMSGGQVRIGIGGWTYPPWRGVFYPDRLPQARELEYASRAVRRDRDQRDLLRPAKPEELGSLGECRARRIPVRDQGLALLRHSPQARRRRRGHRQFLAQGLAALGPKLGPILWMFAARRKFDRDDIAAFLEAAAARSSTAFRCATPSSRATKAFATTHFFDAVPRARRRGRVRR